MSAAVDRLPELRRFCMVCGDPLIRDEHRATGVCSSADSAHTEAQRAIREEWSRLWDSLEAARAQSGPHSGVGASGQDKGTTEARSLLLTPLSQITPRRQRWLWNERIPLGTLTVFAGRGGEGKSTFGLWIVAEAGAGRLEGDLHGEPVSSLIISHEDDLSTVMVPRLTASGANLDAVTQMAVGSTFEGITSAGVPVLPLDLSLLRQAIEETGARIIIIDPITALIAGDMNKPKEVRRSLDPLLGLAQEMDVAVIGLAHFNKGQGNASDKLSGAHSFRDAVRSLLLFATDEETGHRVVSVDKSNYSRARGNSFAFDLVSRDVVVDGGEVASVGAVQYLGDTDVHVQDIINRSQDIGDASESDDAAAWLTDFLVSVGGSAPKRDIDSAAKREGYSDKVIRRAREKAKVSTGRVGFPSTTVWSLPSVEPSQAQSGPVMPTSESGRDWAPVGATELCPVCSEPTGHRFAGYCDRLDNAHALHRADAEAVRA